MAYHKRHEETARESDIRPVHVCDADDYEGAESGGSKGV
jgi:hypothetical protein